MEPSTTGPPVQPLLTSQIHSLVMLVALTLLCNRTCFHLQRMDFRASMMPHAFSPSIEASLVHKENLRTARVTQHIKYVYFCVYAYAYLKVFLCHSTNRSQDKQLCKINHQASTVSAFACCAISLTLFSSFKLKLVN